MLTNGYITLFVGDLYTMILFEKSDMGVRVEIKFSDMSTITQNSRKVAIMRDCFKIKNGTKRAKMGVFVVVMS